MDLNSSYRHQAILATKYSIFFITPDWFGMDLPMEGVKSTSIVYKDLEPIRTEPFACFCAEDQNDCHLELYPRPNGEVCQRRAVWILSIYLISN